MKKRLSEIVLLILMIVVFISACTKKKNPVGFQPGIQPVEIVIDHDLFGNAISFEDSTFNYAANTNLIVGNYFSGNREKWIRALLKCDDLPDSIFQITSDVRIELQIRDRYNFDSISEDDLKLALINTAWQENRVTWYAVDDSTDWMEPGGDFVTIYNDSLQMTVEEDTLNFILPHSIIKNWVEADSVNFGLMLYTENEDAFLQIYSSDYTTDPESKLNPMLNFEYLESENDTASTVFEEELGVDAFIYSFDDEYENYQEQLIISNIRPLRMIINFEINDSIFINTENSGIYDENDYRQMTINRAELILHPLPDNDYPLDASFYLRPYLLTVDSLDTGDNTRPLLGDEDYEYFNDPSSSDTLNTAEFKIDITNALQFITSGERENLGILIRSTYENQNLRHIEFANKDNENEDLRPELKIIYTPPYLND